MKRLTLFAGLLLAGLLVGCSPSEAQTQERHSLSSVRVETLGDQMSAASRRFVGRVDAVSNVDLSFQVGGHLIELPVQQGRLLPKGSLLARLDPADYQLALEQSEVRLKQAERDLQRKQTLLTHNSVPRAAVDEARDQMRLAELAVDSAQRNLSYTRIEAPFDLLITRRLADRYVNLQAGTPVVRVQDVTEFRVHISVPEDLVRRVSDPDQVKAELLLPGSEEKRLPLEYREHATEPDAVIQTYQVTFGFERPTNLNLLPGMTATVVITAQASQLVEEELDLPLSAINTREDGSFYVWIFNPKSGEVRPRSVEVGQLGGDRVELLSGVKAGEQVITAGTSRLREGMQVRPFSQF
ncbi:efflux RND transporter periplasmic adaptor subunit [Marinospirillum sp.]|uniref:efflux RND transporter periplasmic adaptor subunit n=1 Tax=Marinospirillum sp. TaxID=2183934 RepID=UPI00384DAF9D